MVQEILLEKILELRGSRHSRLRSLSLTLNQVPQALLSILSFIEFEGSTDRRTNCSWSECSLAIYHHKHSDEGSTPSLSTSFIKQDYVNIQLGGEHPPYIQLSVFLPTDLFTFALIYEIKKDA
jgi:hypothetical protein